MAANVISYDTSELLDDAVHSSWVITIDAADFTEAQINDLFSRVATAAHLKGEPEVRCRLGGLNTYSKPRD
jgi:hypothetical protein